MDGRHFFEGRELLIATKHRKEQQLAPLLEQALGVHCRVLPDFDSDRFGTFSGEILRSGSAAETLRMKCIAALEESGLDLAVGSEGSFGAHPQAFFAAADEEWLMLMDRRHGFEMVVSLLSSKTNFGDHAVATEEELLLFARQKDFPAHGLILRDSRENPTEVYKDFESEKDLLEAFRKMKKNERGIWVMTDMRAMRNPTRCKVIAEAGNKLIERVLSVCSNCGRPGFGVNDVLRGLPCSLCGAPTDSVQSLIYSCDGCRRQEIRERTDGKTAEDPGFCGNCNP